MFEHPQQICFCCIALYTSTPVPLVCTTPSTHRSLPLHDFQLLPQRSVVRLRTGSWSKVKNRAKSLKSSSPQRLSNELHKSLAETSSSSSLTPYRTRTSLRKAVIHSPRSCSSSQSRYFALACSPPLQRTKELRSQVRDPSSMLTGRVFVSSRV